MLVPITRQLGLMQQQMFDQFQQAMMMMFQMFNTLQRDQIGVIRSELDHLHELSREMQTLQMELAKLAPTPGAVAPAAKPDVFPKQAGNVGAQRPVFQPAATRAPEVRLQTAPQPAMPPKTAPMPASTPMAGNTPLPESPRPAQPASVGQQGTVPAEPAPAANDEAFHAWIAQRIASIQEERQTRWQKVVGYLSGK